MRGVGRYCVSLIDTVLPVALIGTTDVIDTGVINAMDTFSPSKVSKYIAQESK